MPRETKPTEPAPQLSETAQAPQPDPVISASAYAANLDRTTTDLLLTIHGEEKHTAAEWAEVVTALLNRPVGGTA